MDLADTARPLSYHVSGTKMRMDSNLKDAISKASELPWDYSLFVAINSAISPETAISIVSDDEDVIELEKLGFEYLLTVSDMQDVVSNLDSQIGTASIDKYIEALNYYVKNDAFINFSENR